jgi:hypothetical protein
MSAGVRVEAALPGCATFASFRLSSETIPPMATGKEPASDTGRILSDPRSTKKEKEVAASDLAQRRSAPKGKGKSKE